MQKCNFLSISVTRQATLTLIKYGLGDLYQDSYIEEISVSALPEATSESYG